MNSKFKVFVVFILLIVVGVLCYYIVENKDKNIVATPIPLETIKKEYKDKDYIFNTTYSTDDIIFPYINLDYNVVRSVNFKIKKLFDESKDIIKTANYDYYINDKVLSILLTINIDDKNTYYTYNFNLKNGKELLFDDVYNNYSENDISLKTKISNYIDNNVELNKHLEELLLTKEYIVDTSYNKYRVNALSDNVNFFFDDMNNLNVIIKIELNEIYYEYVIFEL